MYSCVCVSVTIPSSSHESPQDEVKIVLVGKYTKFEDSYASVVKALRHAALQCRRKLNLMVNTLMPIPWEQE